MSDFTAKTNAESMSKAKDEEQDSFSFSRMMTQASDFGDKALDKLMKLPDLEVNLGLGDLADKINNALFDKNANKSPQALRRIEVQQVDIELQEKLLADLGENYFKEDFDSVLDVLNSLPVNTDQEYLASRMGEVETVASLLDSKLHNAIQQNSASFVQGMQHIQEVELDLTMTNVLCKNGRRMLKSFDQDLVHSIYKIVSKVKRRKHYMEVISSLNEIQSILQIEQQIKDLLLKGDFPQAMELHVKGLSILPSLEKFSCMNDLRARFRNGQQDIKQQMVHETKTVCKEFNVRKFQNVAKVFILLEDPHELLNLFKKVYLDVVDETANLTIARHLTSNIQPEQAAKISARDLTGMLDTEHFLPCFMDVISNLSSVLFSYHKVCDFLNSIAPDLPAAGQPHPVVNPPPANLAFELTVPVVSMMREAKSMFSGFRKNVWERVQQRIGLLLSSKGASCLSNASLKMNELLHVLNASDKFIAVGECFSGADSKALSESIYKKSKEYFDNVHRESYQVLKQNMEMDSWDALPVPDDFSLHHIKEFRQSRSLMQARAQQAAQVARLGLVCIAIQGLLGDQSERQALFQRFIAGEKLFTALNQHPTSGAASSSKGSDGADGAGDDYADELKIAEEEISARMLARGNNRRVAPVVTLSSNSVLKCIGKYLNLMESLAPISVDAFNGLTELFDFYLYTVFSVFGINTARVFNLTPVQPSSSSSAATSTANSKASSSSSSSEFMSAFDNFGAKMSKFVDGMGDKLDSLRDVGSNNGSSASSGDRDDRDNLEMESLSELRMAVIAIKDRIDRGTLAGGLFSRASAVGARLINLSETVDLESLGSFRGIRARCLAAESLDFMLQLLKECEGRLRAGLPRSAQGRVAAFLQHAETVVADFKSYFYRQVVTLIVSFDPITTEILKCNWEPDDIDSQSNNYVDMIVGRFRAFDKAVQDQTLGGPMPAHILNSIWKELVTRIQEQLVDAYSRVRSCNTEGRAQMSMDATTLKKELDSVTKFKANFGFVNDFVAAFYVREEQFIQWMADHPSYKLSQYQRVAEVGPIKDMDRNKKKNFTVSIASQFEKNVALERRRLNEQFAARKAALASVASSS